MANARCRLPILMLAFILLGAGAARGAPVGGLSPEKELTPIDVETGPVVLVVDGDVIVSPAGSESDTGWPLKSGDILPWGSRIQTDATGTLKLDLGRMGKLSVGVRTKVRFERGDETPNQLLITLAEGVIDCRLDERRAGDYQVTTPVATVGARGTRFEVVAAADGTTEVFVVQGAVEVENAFRGEAAAVVAGEAVRAALDRQLERPAFSDAATRAARRREFPTDSRSNANQVIARIGSPESAALATLSATHREQLRQLAEVTAARRQLIGQVTGGPPGPRPRMIKGLVLAGQELELYRRLSRQSRQLGELQRWLDRAVAQSPDSPELRARAETVRTAVESILREIRAVMVGHDELETQFEELKLPLPER